MANRRIALVTGASRGIGAGIASLLAERGHYVIGTATSDESAERIGAALGEAGEGRRLNLRDAQGIEALFRALAAGPGLPSVLVNNAGITGDGLLLRMKPEQWGSVIDANLNGLYRVTKPALRGMLRGRWGRVVNLSSAVARMGNPGQANYAASKAAVEGFTRALAQEVAARGLTVNAVAPGLVATDMTAVLGEDQVQQTLSRVPLGRMGTERDVAEAVAFLASDAASYITGETLHVNGGLYMG